LFKWKDKVKTAKPVANAGMQSNTIFKLFLIFHPTKSMMPVVFKRGWLVLPAGRQKSVAFLVSEQCIAKCICFRFPHCLLKRFYGEKAYV
jgi:hypothetical protein